MKTIFAVIILNLFIFTQLRTQPVSEWVRSIDGGASRIDYAEDIVTDNFGNIYATGMCRTQPNLINDLITVKYNSAGVEQWRTITLRDTNWSKHGYILALDSGGNVYSAVHSYTTGSIVQRLMVIKYDGATGNILWTKRHQQFIDDAEIHDIEVDAQGNIVLFIQGRVQGGLGDDVFVIKQNPVTGDTLWSRRVSASTSNLPDYAYDNSMAIDENGNIYFSYSGCTVNNKWDCHTVKFDSAGVKQWERKYDNPGSYLDMPKVMNIDSDGSIYITGEGEYSTFYEMEVFSIKYNASGDSLWTKKFRGSYNKENFVRDMKLDDAGNMYVLASQNSNIDSQLTDMTVIKYSPSGALTWAKHHTGSGARYIPNELVIDPADNIYVLGRGGANTELRVTKFTAGGGIIWESVHTNYPSETSASGIALDIANNIIVCAPITYTATGIDFTIIKYSQPQGITNISAEVPNGFSLRQNYPNPFNPVTNIEFSIPKTSASRLSVYDINGKEIAVLINKNLSTGTYKVDFDGSNFASGIYFYVLTADNFTAVKKMLMVK